MSIESSIKEYVKEKESDNRLRKTAELFEDKQQQEENKEGFNFFDWLKNDKNLLEYAQLYNKPKKLNIGESIKFKLLDIKLSVTCPYFADFKEFLKDLKNGTDTSSVDKSKSRNNNQSENHNDHISESIDLSKSTFCGTSTSNIKSEPFQKNSKTGVTRCSKTARFNGYNFGISLPSGDAYDAGKTPGKDSISTIPSWKKDKKPKNSWEGLNAPSFISEKRGNFADIYTSSKSGYGHRAAAFKDDSGQWYVLDPYTRVNGKLDNSPKKLEDYLKTKKIVKAHIYESKGYKKAELKDDKGHGYERSNHKNS